MDTGSFRLGDDTSLDPGTGERLLSGTVDPGDAPPGYQRVSETLAAAAAPARPDELADTGAVAELAGIAARRRERRRATRAWSRLGRLAALTAAALVALGGVGAANGSLPGRAQAVAHDVLDSIGVTVPNSGHARGGFDRSAPKERSQAASTPAPGPTKAPRPAPASAPPTIATPARPAPKTETILSWCRTYVADGHSANRSPPDSATVRQLAELAGGPDKIADYCKHVAPGPQRSGRHTRGRVLPAR
jgi:hypothetical protein